MKIATTTADFEEYVGRDDAAGAIVIDAVICNRQRRRRHHDLKIIPSILGPQIHFGNNAECGNDLVRDVFEEFFRIGNADNFFGVIDADIEFAALRVGETAYPLEIFVAPTFFPFDVLAFFHNNTPASDP